MSNTKIPASTSSLGKAAIEVGKEVATRLAEDAVLYLGTKACSHIKKENKSKPEDGDIKN